MYDTEDLIQLSALQHMVFCERQCALIHIEQTWTESGRTAEGRIMHERVHDESRESRGDVREEMLDVTIPKGALFYGQTRHRLDVVFDEALRRETEDTARRVHDLIDSSETPKPVYEKRCESCPLMSECLPKAIQKRRSVKSYLTRILGETGLV